MANTKQFSFAVFAILLSLILVWSDAVAETVDASQPNEVKFNKNAGRGGWAILKVRLASGEELPLVVDTGSPMTLLDPSLEAKLGKRQMTITFGSQTGGEQAAGIYAAPKLWLGDVSLQTGSYVATYHVGHSVMGIIGMDCLRHYCIQFDFTAGTMRFLRPEEVHPAELGKAYPLALVARDEAPPPLAKAGQDLNVAFIYHVGLLGGAETNLLVDTGDNADGGVVKGAIQGHYWSRFLHFLIKSRAVRLPRCVWDGETYTQLKLVPNLDTNRLGLRFLARHLVTLDFPNRTMYLQKIGSEPLPRK